jgi:hypothetical protein
MTTCLIALFASIPICFFVGWFKGYNQAYHKYNNKKD